jgi:hypothetical protein
MKEFLQWLGCAVLLLVSVDAVFGLAYGSINEADNRAALPAEIHYQIEHQRDKAEAENWWDYWWLRPFWDSKCGANIGHEIERRIWISECAPKLKRIL